MGFIEEHFDAEVAVVMGIGGVIWGLLRFIDNQHKEHLKQWLERIEKNVNEIRSELKEITENLVCPEQIAKMDDEISALQKEINLAREKSVSVERIAKMDVEFQGLRSAIQKTREAMIQAATKEKEDLRRTEESLVRIEKKIDSKVDEKTCHLMQGKK
jgi:predicted  nucleic acid-binding Zn-ribbon protein